MSIQKNLKLNYLFEQSQPGMLLTTAWLHEHGFSNQLIYRYTSSGWLKKIGAGAYLKVGDSLTWAGVLYTLQQNKNLRPHVGGLTAMQLLGKAHFLVKEMAVVNLYMDINKRLPSWLSTASPSPAFFRVHKITLFNKRVDESTLISHNIDGFILLLSCPERAVMEMLAGVPQQESYEHAYYLMENLSQSRYEIIQTLLEKCHSVKVKRLFLHLAERCQHEWLKKLQFEKINLGKGKRVIGKGGQYDAHYKLSVPKLTGDENDEQLPTV